MYSRQKVVREKSRQSAVGKGCVFPRGARATRVWKLSRVRTSKCFPVSIERFPRATCTTHTHRAAGVRTNQASWLAGWLAAWLPGWLAAWLAGCPAGWLPGWLAACLPSWLACRLPAPIGNHPEPSCAIMRKYAVKVDVECATLRRNGQFL